MKNLFPRQDAVQYDGLTSDAVTVGGLHVEHLQIDSVAGRGRLEDDTRRGRRRRRFSRSDRGGGGGGVVVAATVRSDDHRAVRTVGRPPVVVSVGRRRRHRHSRRRRRRGGTGRADRLGQQFHQAVVLVPRAHDVVQRRLLDVSAQLLVAPHYRALGAPGRCLGRRLLAVRARGASGPGGRWSVLGGQPAARATRQALVEAGQQRVHLLPGGRVRAVGLQRYAAGGQVTLDQVHVAGPQRFGRRGRRRRHRWLFTRRPLGSRHATDG